MRLATLLSAPLLAGALLALCCVITRSEAFIGRPSVSKAFLQQQQQQQRQQQHRSPICCSTLPVAMLAPSFRSNRARPTISTSSGDGRRSRSSSTVLFSADGGAPTPNGPGTQNLSREAKLAISVLIDIIGVSSFAVPGIGEATDLGWAPISSALIFYLYGNSIFAGLAFVEEILPGFDVIPTATIAWFLTNSEVGQNVTNAAAGKKNGGGGGAASSTVPPPPAARGGAGSRKVDDDLVQSGVIDVDAQD